MWKTGSNGRTLYYGDQLVGMVDNSTFASAIVATMNGQRIRSMQEVEEESSSKAAKMISLTEEYLAKLKEIAG